MFKNYLKTTVRHLLQHKSYSLINIGGLALGIACCMLILLYVQDELSYDRFHQEVDRTYRVVQEAEGFGLHANTPPPLAPALQQN